MARILLVEDDPLVSKSLCMAMESKGHVVVTAENGDVGMRTFAEGGFDLVVTDIIMPDKEGIGLIIEIRRLSPDVKIVAISGGGRTGNLDFLTMARSLGATAILRKPIRLPDLFAVLNECLGASTATKSDTSAAAR